MSVIAHQTEKEWISANEKSSQRMSQTQAEGAAEQHAARLEDAHHQKDVNQKQHICVKHYFVVSNHTITVNLHSEEEFLGVPLTPPKRVTHFPRLEEGNVPINTSWYGMFLGISRVWESHGPREDIPPLTPDQSEKLIVFRKRILSRIQK
ncbi:hypothetical protein TNCV_1205481 [Trichonephila clavipes]|nr:hypothetical protein TNCV_1205481 [Trichonephila clavipes]